ncbi:MAG: hypothetical protein ACT4OS_10995 [Acidimicrobiales bacterium]
MVCAPVIPNPAGPGTIGRGRPGSAVRGPVNRSALASLSPELADSSLAGALVPDRSANGRSVNGAAGNGAAGNGAALNGGAANGVRAWAGDAEFTGNGHGLGSGPVPAADPDREAATRALGLAIRAFDERLEQLEARVGAMEAIGALVQALRETVINELKRMASHVDQASSAVAHHDGRLAALEARTGALGTIPSRMDSLSREVFDLRRGGDVRARVDELGTALDGSAGVLSRIEALEAARGALLDSS